MRRASPSVLPTGVAIVSLALMAALLSAPPATAGGVEAPGELTAAAVQPASVRPSYADVCDDAGGSPLDLRWADITPTVDALRFTAFTCAAWDDNALDGRFVRWELSGAGGGTPFARVDVTRVDGALTVAVTRAADGAVTHEGPAQRISRAGEARGVRAAVPTGVLDPAALESFTFVLTVHHGTAPPVDRMPEPGEPPLAYPDPCPGEGDRAVLTAAPGQEAVLRSAAGAAGLRVRGAIEAIGALEVEGVAARGLAALERLPGVAAAERPARVQRLEVTPDDPAYPQQWYLPEVEAPRAWRVRTGSELAVAIIDDGVDAARADLAGRVAAGHDTRFDRALPAATSSDRGGHGTAVAGLLTAEGDNGVDIAGVDWTATIVPYRMFDAAGCGDEFHLAAAIVHAAEAGVDAINVSLGTVEDTMALRDAVRFAHGRGVVVVAAVGNVRATGNAPLYPAAYPEAIGVGATLRGGVVAGYSNTGPQVHVVAPGGRGNGQVGDDLLTLGERPLRTPVGGTSFSVPLVTAGVLLHRAVDPGATPSTVADALAVTARDLGPRGHDPASGHGLVDLYRFLLQAGVNRACPPDGVPAAGFADVGVAGVHSPAIDCVVWWGIAQGFRPAEYGPALSVNRAQMATFVARAIEVTGATLPVTRDHFADDDGNHHEDSINKLAEAGIVLGSGGRYLPNAPVSRDQMAAFLVRAYEHVAGEALHERRSPFADVAGNTHQGSIDKAFEAGLVRGRTATTYEPRAAVRRDQMASFIRNLLGAFTRDGHANPPA